MKICRVSSAFPPIVDGRAHHVWGLSVAQAQAGHHVRIYQPHSSSGPEAVPNVEVRRLALPGRPTAVFSSLPLKLWFAVRAGLAFLRAQRDVGFDVVHAHGEIYECIGLSLSCRACRVPLVLTIHGGVNQRRAYALIASRLLPLADQIICVSSDIAEQAVALGVQQERVAVISSGVWLPTMGEVEPRREISCGAIQLVSVGRLQEVKGYTYLLAAMRALGDARVELSIAGDGPERARLEHESDGLANVHLLGQKAPDEVARLLREADLFVLPSVDLLKQAEGTPTALMEAMAAGLPVVCTDAGGIRHLVCDGINGLVVPQRDPDALARAIHQLAAEPELRRAMSEANRQAAQSRAWPAIARQVEEVYQRALALRRREVGA